MTDLTAATWCGLVLAAPTDPPELMCLMSRPASRRDAFAGLLTWTVEGGARILSPRRRTRTAAAERRPRACGRNHPQAVPDRAVRDSARRVALPAVRLSRLGQVIARRMR